MAQVPPQAVRKVYMTKQSPWLSENSALRQVLFNAIFELDIIERQRLLKKWKQLELSASLIMSEKERFW
jgi:hypothetical protein